MDDAQRYSVGELAELGGVSRRTVRYYVQEGLIPTPVGLGRGAHYGPEHLEKLLRVKAMQEGGMMLEEILAAFSGKRGQSSSPCRSRYRGCEPLALDTATPGAGPGASCLRSAPFAATVEAPRARRVVSPKFPWRWGGRR